MDKEDNDEIATGLKPVKRQKHFTESLFAIYITSVVSAAHAEIWTYPLDLVKTRLQIQGENQTLQKTQYRGMTKTMIGIVQEEGFTQLWKGLTPALYRHAIYSGLRVALYDKLRMQFSKDGKLSIWEATLCGAVAGGFAQWIANPAELVKVQSQMEGKRILMGLEPRFHTTGQALKQIYNSGGIKGLWSGSVPAVIRAACVNIGDLSAYDMSKRYIAHYTNLPEHSTLLHFLSSVSAGFIATVITNPADVIKSRVMNQSVDEHGRGVLYKGPADCLLQTVRNEGIFALYKGFLPLWVRLGPWSLVFWLSFERIRNILGGPAY